jgi:hypothetical protein
VTNYRLRKLGRQLAAGEAGIHGRASGSQRWPDQPNMWIVRVYTEQVTYHVPVDDRPSWARYLVTGKSTYLLDTSVRGTL